MMAMECEKWKLRCIADINDKISHLRSSESVFLETFDYVTEVAS